MTYEVVLVSRWGEKVRSVHRKLWMARLVALAYAWPAAPCRAYVLVKWHSADTARERLDWLFRQTREGGAWRQDGERTRHFRMPNGSQVVQYKQAMRWVWL